MKHVHHSDRFVDFLAVVVVIFILFYLLIVRPGWFVVLKDNVADIVTWIVIVSGIASFGLILWLIWHSRGEEDGPDMPHQPFTSRLRR